MSFQRGFAADEFDLPEVCGDSSAGGVAKRETRGWAPLESITSAGRNSRESNKEIKGKKKKGGCDAMDGFVEMEGREWQRTGGRLCIRMRILLW